MNREAEMIHLHFPTSSASPLLVSYAKFCSPCALKEGGNDLNRPDFLLYLL